MKMVRILIFGARGNARLFGPDFQAGHGGCGKKHIAGVRQFTDPSGGTRHDLPIESPGRDAVSGRAN